MPTKTIFDLREPEPGRLDGSSTADIPEAVRRELFECARQNGRINYYYLCAIYRKGLQDGLSFKSSGAAVTHCRQCGHVSVGP